MDLYSPRKQRHSTSVDAHVYRNDGRRLAVRITEMSDDGCRLEGEEMLPIGESIRIAVPRMGQIHAQVRWSLGGSAGARFKDQVSG